eukprot:354571-Chlamydomonas_euryale.AAC.1
MQKGFSGQGFEGEGWMTRPKTRMVLKSSFLQPAAFSSRGFRVSGLRVLGCSDATQHVRQLHAHGSGSYVEALWKSGVCGEGLMF